MSAYVMVTHHEELIDSVELGSVATSFIGSGEESDMSLLI